MAQTQPPSIPAGPTTAPQRGNAAAFSDAFEAFLTWFIGNFAAIITAIGTVYSNAVDAYNSAMIASNAAVAALATSNAVPWVSGTTYQKLAAVISPTDGKTYRRITAAGSGTTDPYNDPTNYARLTWAALPTFRAQKQSGLTVAGGSSIVGTQARVLDTVTTNTIPGAALASNQITLPAGTYKVTGSAPAYSVANHQVFLYSVTASAVILAGTSETAPNTSPGTQNRSFLIGEITLTQASVLEFRHFTATAVSTLGLGVPTGTPPASGYIVHAEILFEKVA